MIFSKKLGNKHQQKKKKKKEKNEEAEGKVEIGMTIDDEDKIGKMLEGEPQIKICMVAFKI